MLTASSSRRKKSRPFCRNNPAVREVVIVARPDAARGEAACAIIVPTDGAAPNVEELRRFCRERLASPKVPRLFEFRDTLPRSALGKVLRQLL